MIPKLLNHDEILDEPPLAVHCDHIVPTIIMLK